MFVALVVMALFTSLISAPAMHFLIRSRREITLKETITTKLFLPELKAHTKLEALEQMCAAAANTVNNAPERFLRLILEREAIVPSGWENGLAGPHARVGGLPHPIVVLGKYERRIAFAAWCG